MFPTPHPLPRDRFYYTKYTESKTQSGRRGERAGGTCPTAGAAARGGGQGQTDAQPSATPGAQHSKTASHPAPARGRGDRAPPAPGTRSRHQPRPQTGQWGNSGERGAPARLGGCRRGARGIFRELCQTQGRFQHREEDEEEDPPTPQAGLQAAPSPAGSSSGPRWGLQHLPTPEHPGTPGEARSPHRSHAGATGRLSCGTGPPADAGGGGPQPPRGAGQAGGCSPRWPCPQALPGGRRGASRIRTALAGSGRALDDVVEELHGAHDVLVLGDGGESGQAGRATPPRRCQPRAGEQGKRGRYLLAGLDELLDGHHPVLVPVHLLQAKGVSGPGGRGTAP